ncbi:hypothetical protein BCR33DRAFT_717170 [Rhizoclosmatium globosum]|uniref:Uncharacterized protein n=1 Tax=Rhizoclosmatium globosum TaxID=329046 RepID=A0A1Y2CAK7_9FUNG|nr:hypothetical protein BCR33DRAFT_717170 [Rhizoclosmatium globosum]|eukprot:ORY44068.1 hypothetical protein BCR33DRAFT_717170 [Rhizoclosmatium globosum]
MQYFPQSECYNQSFIGGQAPFRHRPWYSSSDLSLGFQGLDCPLGFSGLDSTQGLNQRYYGRQNIGRGAFSKPWMNALENDCYNNNQFSSYSHHHSGINARNMMHAAKANIVDELVQDRQRDELQADLIKQLIKKSSTTTNRMGVVQALLSGQNIPKSTVAKLLTQDFIMDQVTQGLVTKILDDKVTNRNADHIIHDLVTGNPHLPHPNQRAAVERENFLIDDLTSKAVQRVTSPYANQRFASADRVANVLESFAAVGQQTGIDAIATPFGVQYGGIGGLNRLGGDQGWC